MKEEEEKRKRRERRRRTRRRKRRRKRGRRRKRRRGRMRRRRRRRNRSVICVGSVFFVSPRLSSDPTDLDPLGLAKESAKLYVSACYKLAKKNS